MIARGEGGSLAVTASLAALEGAPLSAHYAASKGAMLSVMRALAVGLARHRIRVNAIVPGWIDTPMTEKAVHGEAFKTRVLPRVPAGRGAPGEASGGSAVSPPGAAGGHHPGDTFVIDGGYAIFGGLPPLIPLPPRGRGRGGGRPSLRLDPRHLTRIQLEPHL